MKLNFVFDIKKKYKGKKIYIWDVNRNSHIVFAKLFFSCNKIDGFVCEKEKYVGDHIFNIPVVGINEFEIHNSVLVLPDYPDTCKEDMYNKILSEMHGAEIVWYNDMYSVSEGLLKEEILIYGTGKAGEQMLDICRKNGIGVKGFINSNIDRRKTFKGHRIQSSEILIENKETPIVVAAIRDEAKEEIIGKLYDNKCNKVFVNNVIKSPDCIMEPMFLRVAKALKEKKDIYIYSDKNAYLDMIQLKFQQYGILIKDIVYRVDDPQNGIKDVYSLVYKNVKEIFVFINERNENKMQLAVQTLKDIGLKWENYTGIIQSRSNYLEYKVMPDLLVGGTILGNRKKKGFYVWGEDQKEDFKILILGGSTSTEKAYLIDTWVCILFNKYLKGKNITIYNGANCGFDVVQELLVLLRDGPVIKPNIVISMSGVNNLYSRAELPIFFESFFDDYKYTKIVNNFNVLANAQWLTLIEPNVQFGSGLSTKENRFDFWERNEKIICEVAKIIGAKPYVFLQPMRIDEKKMDLYEYGECILEEQREHNKYFLDASFKQKNFYNLVELWKSNIGMYIDGCHYTTEASEMIADYVFKTIQDELELWQSKKNKYVSNNEGL